MMSIECYLFYITKNFIKIHKNIKVQNCCNLRINLRIIQGSSFIKAANLFIRAASRLTLEYR